MLAMTRNEAVPLKSMQAGLPWDWETFPEFLDSLDRIPKGVNVLTYAPLAPLFNYVMGSDEAKRRRPTDAERGEMCRLLEEAMEAGACGFSTQWLGAGSHQRDYDGTPMVTDTIDAEDLVPLAEVLRRLGRGVIQGIGGRFEDVGKPGGGERPALRLQHGLGRSPISTACRPATPRRRWSGSTLRTVRGNRIFGQATTIENELQFTLEDWNLFDFSPLWREATIGTPPERAEKLADPGRRAELKAEYDEGFNMGIVGPERLP